MNQPQLKACFAGFLMLAGSVAALAADTNHYDLRVYQVTPGKTAGVLERFREFVERVRVKHGIKTVGYWLSPGATNDTFAYILTAPTKEELSAKEKEFGNDPEFKTAYAANSAKYGKTLDGIRAFGLSAGEARLDLKSSAEKRAFDLRIYTVAAGKTEAFWNRWLNHAVPIYERHGLHSVGAWKSKDKEGNDLVVCLLAGSSVEGIQKSITAFHADAEWQKIEKDTEKEGPLRTKVEAFKMTATDFSPLK